MKNKNTKKSRVSLLKMLKREWNGLVKPSPKELAVMTARTVVIAAVAALAINVVDIGFTQLLLVLSNLT